jgi:hypothetical protein
MLPPIRAAPAKKPSGGRKRTGDRFAEVNGFVDFTLAKLKPAEVAVWLILWRDTKPDGHAKTGMADLAQRSGYSVRMVKYAVASLIEKQLIKVVRVGRIGAGASVYKVRGVNPG